MEEMKAMARRLQEGTLTAMDSEETGDLRENGVQMLLDTGASLSVIGMELVTRFGLSVYPTSGSLRGADGYRYNVLGATQVEIEVEGMKKRTRDFFVINGSQLIGSTTLLNRGENWRIRKPVLKLRRQRYFRQVRIFRIFE